jgi:6-phosphogluconate dehydrogenase
MVSVGELGIVGLAVMVVGPILRISVASFDVAIYNGRRVEIGSHRTASEA